MLGLTPVIQDCIGVPMVHNFLEAKNMYLKIEMMIEECSSNLVLRDKTGGSN